MVIAISGRAGSGKDTFAKMLQLIDAQVDPTSILTMIRANANPHFNNFSDLKVQKFAKKLKQSIELKFPNLFEEYKWETEGSEYRDEFLPELQMTRRDLLIKEGHGLRQVVSPIYWVTSLFSQELPDDIVITDMRYRSEFDVVEKMDDAFTIRMTRPDLKLIDSPSERDLDEYVELDKFSYRVNNNHGLEDLLLKATQIYADIKENCYGQTSLSSHRR